MIERLRQLLRGPEARLAAAADELARAERDLAAHDADIAYAEAAGDVAQAVRLREIRCYWERRVANAEGAVWRAGGIPRGRGRGAAFRGLTA